MSNPIFRSVNNQISYNDKIVSFSGTIIALALFFIIFTVSFSFSWQASTVNLAESLAEYNKTGTNVFVNQNCMNFAIFGSLFGFVLAIITIFNPNYSAFFGSLYSVAQGVSLGAITAYTESIFPGIACKTIGITFSIFIGCFTLYSTGIFKVTQGFYKFIMISMFGILGIYFSNLILHFFGSYLPIVEGKSFAALAFQFFIVIIASLNFMLDFDQIEDTINSQGPSYLNFYNAFGLMTTFVWLYIEILDLLMKLKSDD